MDYSTLYYVHDPMCSWCWGYRPAFEALKAGLPEDINIEYVLGGLAPDNDQVMPAELQATIKGHWNRIQSMLGTPFNFEFWEKNQPRRDTYKACRAVIAASRQDAEELMIDAIQRAYYLRALNPSEFSVLEQLAHEADIDAERFRSDLHDPQTDAELRGQLALRDRLGVNSYPGLVLQHSEALIPIRVNYQNAAVTLHEIGLARQPKLT